MEMGGQTNKGASCVHHGLSVNDSKYEIIGISEEARPDWILIGLKFGNLKQLKLCCWEHY